MTARTPKTLKFDTDGMTEITPDTLKSGDEMTARKPKAWKIGKNDEMVAIIPLGQKISQCYSHPL